VDFVGLMTVFLEAVIRTVLKVHPGSDGDEGHENVGSR